MRSWLRYSLYVLGAIVLLLALGTAWLLHSFDGERIKRIAADWLRNHHQRELVIDGPVTLQLWPQPALTLKAARLSEAGQPGQPFASIADAALSLRLEPLWRHREFEIDKVSARGVKLELRRDAQGRSNIDDFLGLATGNSQPQPGGRPFVLESLDLSDAELQVDDALRGLHGRVAVQRLTLGRFGPGLSTPLHLQAQAALSQPTLNASLSLDAGLQLLPAAAPGTVPQLRLDRAVLRLKGNGAGIEGLELALQAASMQLDYGNAATAADTQLRFDDLQLRFSGSRLGWQVDAGKIGLARLQLDVGQRRLALEKLVLSLQGHHAATTLDAQLDWPALAVQGDSLQGGPVSGQIQLGGERRLLLKLQSQAPSGNFEHIALPQLQFQVDGELGTSRLQGTGQATLRLEPAPWAAAIDGLQLQLQVDDPSLPALTLALAGEARVSDQAASVQARGTVNEQRFDARIDADLAPSRPRLQVDANFTTLDLNRFIAPSAGPAGPAPAPAALALSLQPLLWADGSVRLQVARLSRAPYQIDALVLRARVANGTLDLQQLTGRAWGGRFDASGSASAADNRLRLRLRGDDVDMRALLADTTGYDGLRGRGRIDADLNSRGSTVGALRSALGGRLVLRLQPAALRGVDLTQTLGAWRTLSASGSDVVASSAVRQTDFSLLAASFELRDGVARSSDLQGESEFLRVSGEGSFDLGRGSLDYLLRTRVVNTASGRAGPEMVFLNGVTVPVQLQGPFGNIQWQVGWGAVSAGVAARSVPNVVRGTVGGVARGAAGLLGAIPGVVSPAPR